MAHYFQDVAGGNVPEIVQKLQNPAVETLVEERTVKMAQDAIENIFNHGENDEALELYKESMRRILLCDPGSKEPPVQNSDYRRYDDVTEPQVATN